MTDGRVAGTCVLESGGSEITELVNVNNVLYFLGDDSANDMALWTSDGTPEGTVMVADIPGNGPGRKLRYLTEANGKLFVSAWTEAYNEELWYAELSVAQLPGDYTSDGAVDGADFLAWQREFGLSATPVGSGADGNRDGAVDDGDLEVWSESFSASQAPAFVTAPTSFEAASLEPAELEDVASTQRTHDEVLSALYGGGDFTTMFAASDSKPSIKARRRPK